MYCCCFSQASLAELLRHIRSLGIVPEVSSTSDPADHNLPHGEQPLGLGGDFPPWSVALKDGIGVDEELSGAGDERLLVALTGLFEAGIEGDEGGVPLEGSR